VHKLVEIARFSPRKVQKRGFFAGGRGDFLAGQKRGFLGSRGVRGVTRGGADFESNSKPKNRTDAPTRHSIRKQKKYFIFLFPPFTKSVKKNRRGEGMLRMHPDPPTIYVRLRTFGASRKDGVFSYI
jgi:hypothetical protein